MEQTRAEIDADIASLRANVAKYRALAEERKALGQLTADLESGLARSEAKVADPTA